MKVMLGSGGFRGEQRRQALCDAMRQHFGDIQQLLFVPYALHDGDDYIQKMVKAGYNADYDLVGIHNFDDPVAAVEQAQGIYVGGGNSFRLIHRLQQINLVDVIRRRVVAGELPYLGISAGTNVACPTMMTTNDMPIVQPRSFDSMGLVPFQINTHYYPGQIHIRDEHGNYHEHFGETRLDRIREFHECQDVPVLGLWEAGWLMRTDEKLVLHHCPALLFRKDQQPQEIEVGADLSFLLTK
jgi:dipeptidase E